MNKQLKPYAGPLAVDEIVKGIAAAQANAARLLEDAKLLFAAERFPSSAALAILAMEERGKVTILRRLSLLTESKALRDAWREYRNHRAKNTGWIIPTLMAEGARNFAGLAPALNKDGDHAWALDALKQVAIYTDCLGERRWSIPAETIDSELCESLMLCAENMWGRYPITDREMELWVEIVGPVYAQSGMLDAVMRFQAAMHAEGLSEHSPESFRAFVEGGPVAVSNAGKGTGEAN